MSKKKGKEEQTLDEKLKMAIIPKEEEPYKVPDNWVWTRLGNITEKNQYGYTAKSSNQGEVKYLRITDIQDNKVVWNDVPYCEIKEDEFEKFKLKKDDIVIARTGATTGKSFLIKEINHKSVFASYLIRVRGIKVLSEYLWDYMNANIYWQQITEFSSGIAQPGVNAQKLENLLIPLPPIDEQKRIVNKLDYFFDKIQKVKEIIEEIKEKNEARKESILSKAFTGELTAKWRADNIHSAKELLSKISDEKLSNWEQECQKAEAEGRKKPTKPKLKSIDEMIVPNDEIPYEIPNNWVWTRLEDISYNFQVGLVKSALEQSEDKEYKYLKMNNITNDGKLTLDQLVCVDATLEEYEKFKLKKGDFLFNTRNSYELVGKNTVFDLEEDYLYNNNILKINFYEGVNSKVISYYLNSPMGRDRLTEIKSGTTNVSAIYAKDLKKVTIPLPPIEEQKEIVRILDNIFTKENLINELISLEDKIQALEKSILSKAFRGELGTNSKDDIEAMELLKEILQK